MDTGAEESLRGDGGMTWIVFGQTDGIWLRIETTVRQNYKNNV